MFAKRVARDLAHYAYHYKVLEAKLKAYEWAWANHSGDSCTVCHVPYGKDERALCCRRVHASLGPHISCGGRFPCGRAWCVQLISCVTCDASMCRTADVCMICSSSICLDCSRMCGKCNKRVCAKHTHGTQNCEPCTQLAIEIYRANIFHLENRHVTPSVSDCTECRARVKAV